MTGRTDKLHSALVAELRRQNKDATALDKLHYLSLEDGNDRAHVDGVLDLDEMAKALDAALTSAPTVSTDERVRFLQRNLKEHGTVDAEDLEWLLEEDGRNRALLRECLGDYGHPNFTDRHGMADRLRRRLGIKPKETDHG